MICDNKKRVFLFSGVFPPGQVPSPWTLQNTYPSLWIGTQYVHTNQFSSLVYYHQLGRFLIYALRNSLITFYHFFFSRRRIWTVCLPLCSICRRLDLSMSRRRYGTGSLLSYHPPFWVWTPPHRS